VPGRNTSNDVAVDIALKDVGRVCIICMYVTVSISSGGVLVRNASTDVLQRNPITDVSVRTALKRSRWNACDDWALSIAGKDVCEGIEFAHVFKKNTSNYLAVRNASNYVAVQNTSNDVKVRNACKD
jgi:hypothetical protein